MRHTYKDFLLPTLVIILISGGYAFHDQLTALISQPQKQHRPIADHNEKIVPKNTLSQIQQNLAQREYHISYDSLKHSLQSPNRKQGIRAYYKPGLLTIVNRKDSAGHNFRLDLVNEGIYADGKMLFGPQSSTKAQPEDNKLRIHHKGFIEEYINDPSGVRQNFIIENAPEGVRQLQVKLTVSGMRVSDSRNNELLLTPQNAARTDQLHYRDLHCWDANQQPLDASLTYADGKILINVDVQSAAFPVTIDPLVVNGNPGNADALLEGNKAGAQMGYCVSTAGDINNDGYSDVLVGAPLYDNGQVKEGAVFVYYGAATGLSPNNPQILETNKTGSLMGYSVASAGDVNNDGFADVVIGAPLATNGHYAEGVAWVYYGAAGGLPTQPSRLLEINQAESRMGFSVAGAGDVNGDGFSDIIVGAYQYDNGQNNEGLTLIYYGSPGGVSTQANWSEEGNQAEAWAGYSVRGAGDIDGDGYGDVLSGAPTYDNGHTNEGIVKIYHGSAALIDPAKTKTIESNQNGALLGYSVSGAGDINGDGFSDVILGAPLYTKGEYAEGVAFIHHGSAIGLTVQPALILEVNQAESRMGHSVACAGDVDGDGFADVIVGAYLFDNGLKDEGAVYVYQGRGTGLNPTPISVIEGEQIDGYLGHNVAPAGDINGDGYSDIIAGSYVYDHGEKDEGAAFVWMGGVNSIENNANILLSTAQINTKFGYSVSKAGDVNGDGYGDVIVGAPDYDNGQQDEGIALIYYGSTNGIDNGFFSILGGNQTKGHFGGAVATAGDVNGDGFDDIIVGATGFITNGKITGAAFVYLGGAGGINTNSSVALFNNNFMSNMGCSVSSAGDLNGDGYSDVVVGASRYSNVEQVEGAAFFYYGSPNGVLGANPLVFEGNQSEAQAGCSVATAGDINGDGYDDAVVGAMLYDINQQNEGAAFLFYGSSNGISSVPSYIIEGNENDAQMGNAVAPAGDFNGDGYSDLAVSAWALDVNGDLNKGGVFFFAGSSNGLSNNNKVTAYGDQFDANFGQFIASAGDLNNDGYSDVLVSAPYYDDGQVDEGIVFVFNGSPSGILISDPVRLEGNQEFTYWGLTSSGAGDLNGDGVDDVIIGSAGYKSQQNHVGAAAVLLGNSTSGIRNNLRLYNSSDLLTPINHTQFAQNSFGAGLFAKSFLGRNKGKLVWETKPANQGFSKGTNNSITNSTQSTSSQNGYTNLGLAGIELKNIINKQGAGTKVRVRVKYHPTLALTGQAYGPWRYLPAYLMGNSTAPVPEEAENGLSETIKRKAAGLEKELEATVVYPNPASDQLNVDIKNADQVINMKILTPTGSLAYQTQRFKPSLDLSKFSEGTYFLIITKSDGSQVTRKILVKR